MFLTSLRLANTSVISKKIPFIIRGKNIHLGFCMRVDKEYIETAQEFVDKLYKEVSEDETVKKQYDDYVNREMYYILGNVKIGEEKFTLMLSD
jgi:hypothetical protein